MNAQLAEIGYEIIMHGFSKVFNHPCYLTDADDCIDLMYVCFTMFSMFLHQFPDIGS